MKWLLDYLGKKPPELGPQGLDCVNCQVAKPLSRPGHYNVTSKCCDFSPFISAFAIGVQLEKDSFVAFEKVRGVGDLVWTKLGVIHSQAHHEDLGALCEFFDEGRCSIWAHRPPTCYSFFCAGFRDGVEGQFESWAMEKEASLVRGWFETLDLPEAVWEEWCIALDRNPGSQLPAELVINPEEALSYYKRAFQWLNTYSHD